MRLSGLGSVILACTLLYAAPTLAAIKDVLNSVCVITTRDASGNDNGQGSAVIISTNGFAITCFHVLSGSISASVKMSDGAEHPVSGFSHADPDNDFAIIQIIGPGEFIPAVIGTISEVDIGDEVYSIGNPKGWEGTVAQGIISAIRVTPEFGKIIQTTAPISPGSSGGALVNKAGHLIGITKFLWKDSQNLNFATPIDIVVPYIEKSKIKPLTQLPDAPVEFGQEVRIDVLLNLMAEGGWQADLAVSISESLDELKSSPIFFPMYLIVLAKENRFDDAKQIYRSTITNSLQVTDDILAARAYVILKQAEFEKTLKNKGLAYKLFQKAGDDALAVLKKNKKHAFACSIYLDAHFGAEAYGALDHNSKAAIRNFPQFLFPWRQRLWALVFLDRYDEALDLSNIVLRRDDIDQGAIYFWRGLFIKWKLMDYGYIDSIGRQLASDAIREFQRAVDNGNPDGYSGIREVRNLGF